MSKQRRVVCAAIRAEDGSLLLGIRHYSADMHAQIASRVDGEKFKHRHGDDQGFVDQKGQYMTRKVAWEIAESAGQVQRLDSSDAAILYSEDLY